MNDIEMVEDVEIVYTQIMDELKSTTSFDNASLERIIYLTNIIKELVSIRAELKSH